MTIDHELAKQLSEGINVELYECYRNARAVLKSRPSLKARLRYVEGWCVSGGYPGNHGWLVLDGNTIIDVTPTYQDTCADDYFPGVSYSYKEITFEQTLESGTMEYSRYAKKGKMWEAIQACCAYYRAKYNVSPDAPVLTRGGVALCGKQK